MTNSPPDHPPSGASVSARRTVLLLEDQVAYRESLGIAIARSNRFEVLAQADSAREALCLLERRQPDLVVAEFILADTDAASFARELRRRHLDLRLLVLGALRHPMFVDEALSAGASGYVLKDQPLAEILEAMDTVTAGGRYLSPLLTASRAASRPAHGLSVLSRREQEVLSRLLRGLSSNEIARLLHISPRTVDAHRLQINRKLGMRTPSELVQLAVDSGLVLGAPNAGIVQLSEEGAARGSVERQSAVSGPQRPSDA